ncbi:hypothetical protein [Mucilaginibacter sp.]
MKVAYKAADKRNFNLRWAFNLGFGYERTILNKDGAIVTEVVCWYLPFCILSAVQVFAKAPNIPQY